MSPHRHSRDFWPLMLGCSLAMALCFGATVLL